MEVLFGRDAKFVSLLRFTSSSVTTNYSRFIRYAYCIDTRYWQFRWPERHPHCRGLYILASNPIVSYQKSIEHRLKKNDIKWIPYRDFKQQNNKESNQSANEKSLSVFEKMKKLTKEYWHILIPVHIVTSIGWVAFGYALVKNGVDIVSILEYLSVNEKTVALFRNSNAGTWALTYGIYKILTPLRYTVTIGGTTMAIKRLQKLGYVPKTPFKFQSSQTAHNTDSTAAQMAKQKTLEQTKASKT